MNLYHGWINTVCHFGIFEIEIHMIIIEFYDVGPYDHTRNFGPAKSTFPPFSDASP